MAFIPSHWKVLNEGRGVVGPDLHFEKVTVLYLEKTWNFVRLKGLHT